MINFSPTKVASASKYRPLVAKTNTLMKRPTTVSLDQVLASRANIITKLTTNVASTPSSAIKIPSTLLSRANA